MGLNFFDAAKLLNIARARSQRAGSSGSRLSERRDWLQLRVTPVAPG